MFLIFETIYKLNELLKKFTKQCKCGHICLLSINMNYLKVGLGLIFFFKGKGGIRDEKKKEKGVGKENKKIMVKEKKRH